MNRLGIRLRHAPSLLFWALGFSLLAACAAPAPPAMSAGDSRAEDEWTAGSAPAPPDPPVEPRGDLAASQLPSSDPNDPAGCVAVCSTLSACAKAPLPECAATCMQSHWIQAHGGHCLTLRIGWIDEEGCASMLATYRSFDVYDDCDSTPRKPSQL